MYPHDGISGIGAHQRPATSGGILQDHAALPACFRAAQMMGACNEPWQEALRQYWILITKVKAFSGIEIGGLFRLLVIEQLRDQHAILPITQRKAQIEALHQPQDKMCVFRGVLLFCQFLFGLRVSEYALSADKGVQQRVDSLRHPFRFQNVVEPQPGILPIIEGDSKTMKKAAEQGLAGWITLAVLLTKFAVLIKGDMFCRHL